MNKKEKRETIGQFVAGLVFAGLAIWEAISVFLLAESIEEWPVWVAGGTAVATILGVAVTVILSGGLFWLAFSEDPPKESKKKGDTK